MHSNFTTEFKKYIFCIVPYWTAYKGTFENQKINKNSRSAYTPEYRKALCNYRYVIIVKLQNKTYFLEYNQIVLNIVQCRPGCCSPLLDSFAFTIVESPNRCSEWRLKTWSFETTFTQHNFNRYVKFWRWKCKTSKEHAYIKNYKIYSASVK